MAEDSPALADIRATHPGRLLIPLADAAPFVAQSPSAAAKLAQRERFPVKPKKVGGRWMVNVRDLAAFIDSPGEEDGPPAASPTRTKAAKSKATKSTDETSKTVRPPSMTKLLLAMRMRVELTRAQLDFELAVFAEMEALAVRRVAKEPKLKTPKARRTL